MIHLLERMEQKQCTVCCLLSRVHCHDGSVYKKVFYCNFGVKMREFICLDDKEAPSLDFIISANYNV